MWRGLRRGVAAADRGLDAGAGDADIAQFNVAHGLQRGAGLLPLAQATPACRNRRNANRDGGTDHAAALTMNVAGDGLPKRRPLRRRQAALIANAGKEFVCHLPPVPSGPCLMLLVYPR